MSSLAALASGSAGTDFSLIDAEEGEVFAALVEAGEQIWPPFAGVADELVARLA